MENTLSENLGIAVIGMSGRFPGARDIRAFWENLKNGTDVLSVFSEDELRGHVPEELLKKQGFVKAGYVLHNVDEFDAAFFGYSPKEAESIDPQQRLFLECAWEAFEDAGYVPGKSGSVGVFAGVNPSSYLPFDVSLFPGAPGQFFESLLGNDKDYAAPRVSYKLNLKGPAFSVQSACSSSLVSVCTACHALLDFQCDMALAGGASISLPECTGYMTSEEGGLSKDGRCHAFDHRASGMNSGNGVAVVLLKRVEEAVADGDHIYGVIRGFAINNDGADKVGFVAPSVRGQKEVITEALAVSGFDPQSISYIEAHGTGTPLGDPIEIRALAEVYGKNGAPCAITSVKTNIGHLNSAAGAAGLIRVMLSLEHRTLTPLLNFEKPNPEIDFSQTRFFPNTELKPWDASPLRAGISSFGLGGTNAHILVEEAPRPLKTDMPRVWKLVPLSARTPEALELQAERLRDFLRAHSDCDLNDVAYTLQHGREQFAHRLVALCRDVAELETVLAEKTWIMQTPAHGAAVAADKKVFFLFPGAGASYAGMGRTLYEREPVFRAAVDTCAKLLVPLLGADIRTALYADSAHSEASAMLQKPAFGFAALFVTEYALACQWMNWGVEPSGCVGHSFGQYAAAVLCGVFSLEDALRVTVRRGQLMEQCQPGAMLMIFAPEKTVQSLLTGTLSIAAVNTGLLCTVAGSIDDIALLESRLGEKRIRFKRLAVSRAGHNCLMDPILEDFQSFMETIPMNAPCLPMLSNVSGSWLNAHEAQSAGHWTAHIRQTVRFSDNMSELFKDPNAVFLEVGPGKGLTSFVRRHGDFLDTHAAISSMHGADDIEDDDVYLLNAYGKLFLAGVKLNWFCSDYARGHPGRVSLPVYPFERERYWSDRAPGGRMFKGQGNRALMRSLMDKREDSEQWFFLPVWERGCLLTELSAGELEKLDRDWLVFADDIGFGEAVAKRLEAAGKQTALVRPGSCFVRNGRNFEVQPSEEADYISLFKALHEEGMQPGRIIHAWSVTADESLGQGLAFCETCLPTGYRSLIALVRALFSAGMEKLPVSIGVISNHLHSVLGNERLSPEKVLVLGPCKVIPSEFLRVRTINIDIETPISGVVRRDVMDAVIRDLAALPHGEEKTGEAEAVLRCIVAYRGRYRWTQSFDNVRLPTPEADQIPLRDNGVYLITGGFGGVAFELSKHLAKTRRARLILTGRTALPPREEWDSWLAAHEEADPVSQRIRQVHILENMGAQVLPVCADVADRDSMICAWKEAERVFGAINGVFHAASTATSSMIQAQTEKRSFSVIAPKVHGTFVLDELGQGNLDFLMLFSSISSHVGALGHTDYTAACLFMDTFAHMKNRTPMKTRIVAVNWGYWDGVGIGVQLLPRLKELMGDVPIQGILPSEGMKCMERALAAPVEQLIVSTSDYGALMETFLRTVKRTLTDYESFHTGKTVAKRPRLATPYVAPSNDVERVVSAIWQELFGIEAVGIHDSFIELGGDSLHALPLISRLEEIFRLKIPIRDLLEENTVAKLAAFLVRNEKKEGQTLKIARLYMKVRGMSPEEVQKMLAEKTRN